MPDLASTVDTGARGDVAVIADDGVMFDECGRINDSVASNFSTRIHDCTMEHDSAFPKSRMTGNMGPGRANDWQPATHRLHIGKKAFAQDWRLDLTGRNEEKSEPLGQESEVFILAKPWITEDCFGLFIDEVDKTGDFKVTCGFHNVGQ